MIFLMCGVPGSGKSTHAKLLAKTANATILCPDDFRKELTDKWFYGPAEDTVWATVRLTARVLMKTGQRVIIDATALTKHRRNEWVRMAQQCDNSIHAYAHVTPVWLCKTNNEERERVVPENVLKGQIEQYTIPTVAEGFQHVALWDIVDGNFTLVGAASNQPGGVMADGRYGELAGQRCYN